MRPTSSCFPAPLLTVVTNSRTGTLFWQKAFLLEDSQKTERRGEGTDFLPKRSQEGRGIHRSPKVEEGRYFQTGNKRRRFPVQNPLFFSLLLPG